jgi:hypothetical protein
MFCPAERLLGTMKKRKMTYWMTTARLALGFLASCADDLGQSPAEVQSIQHLGYPTYFAALIELACWGLRPESRRVLETRTQALTGSASAALGRSTWLAS